MVDPDRVFFVRVMREWVSRFTGKVIENFEIHLSQPMGFAGDIMSLTEFATSRQVKNLVLDFSDPIQRNLSQAQQTIRDCLLRCRYLQKNDLDVSHLFFNLLYVRTLTVCSFFLQRAPSPLVIDPVSYWLTSKAYECLEKTLKVVKVKKFRGSSNELHMLQYLIRTGCVMERVDLYEANGLNHNQKRWVLAVVEEFQQNFKSASGHLRITLHNA
ncbi:unnamed protein product [Arabidopsis arenosa]|uniref:FBD domain-containing protein n=1 Tax=Arabidopsis arenosa TaxID=38785 RepID=A0A8S2A0Q3_ARAAE|nr:unnamed protein product [Arabidopsis arenosa]